MGRKPRPLPGCLRISYKSNNNCGKIRIEKFLTLTLTLTLYQMERDGRKKQEAADETRRIAGSGDR
jgi:hypothetical protein